MADNLDVAGARFQRAVEDLLAIDYPTALSIVTGTFVSLTLEVMRRHGHEPSGDVRIDGGENRDITIHAPKAGGAR
ncbi:hypothetical protein [Rubrivivax gelatinosus]|uniref:hypothetical protein n=1 Tax=Rubrivivax gelatinosus TaxID=28068 RepID=UPI00104C7C3B|nr:hypothetical protein [Rubrivivax gelatinosus]